MAQYQKWLKYVLNERISQLKRKFAHDELMRAAGLTNDVVPTAPNPQTNTALQSATEDTILADIIDDLYNKRIYVTQYCRGLGQSAVSDLSQSLANQSQSAAQKTLKMLTQHLLADATYDRPKQYALDVKSLDKANTSQPMTDAMCSRLLQGLSQELEFAVRRRLEMFLATVPIGGNNKSDSTHKRRFNVSPILEYVLQHRLERLTPVEIYHEMVKRKMQDDLVNDEELDENQFVPLAVDNMTPDKTAPRILTENNQLCISKCKFDNVRKRSVCQTNPYGLLRHTWDYCDGGVKK